MLRTETAASDRSDVTLTGGEEPDHTNTLGQEGASEATEEKEVYEPRFSWFLTVLILAVVSVVRTMHIFYRDRVFTVSFSAGSHHCGLVGGDGERDFRNPVH